MIIRANQNHEQGPNEVVTYVADFTTRLLESQLLTGTPTVEEVGGSTLTITAKSVLAAEYTDSSGTVAAGKGVVFTVAGTAVNSDGGDKQYEIKVFCGTTVGSNVREMYCPITGTTKA